MTFDRYCPMRNLKEVILSETPKACSELVTQLPPPPWDPPPLRVFQAQSFEDVSGETGRTTSRAAAQSSDLGGCLRRNAQSRTTQKREL